jgi:hypothetical protein
MRKSEIQIGLCRVTAGTYAARRATEGGQQDELEITANKG